MGKGSVQHLYLRLNAFFFFFLVSQGAILANSFWCGSLGYDPVDGM